MAAPKKKRSARPCFEEAQAPSAEWLRARQELLGDVPADVLTRLFTAHESENDASKKEALHRARVRAQKLIDDADVRLAIKRFRDALNGLIPHLEVAAEAARVRQSELDHRVEEGEALLARPIEPSLKELRTVINRAELAERFGFIQVLRAFPDVVRKERDFLARTGDVEHKRGDELRTLVARELRSGGFSYDEIVRFVHDNIDSKNARKLRELCAALEQRVYRANREERELHAKLEKAAAERVRERTASRNR